MLTAEAISEPKTEAVNSPRSLSGSRAGIAGVYQRHGWDREKAEALRAWARHVLACAEGRAEPGKVVQLHSAMKG